jgi:hypothetical protein
MTRIPHVPTMAPSEITAILNNVDVLLNEGKPKQALEMLARAKLESEWLRNAAAVCHLRSGNAQAAVDLLRPLVIDERTFNFRDDTPLVFRTNFAVALFLANNVEGCLSALRRMKDIKHAGLERLREAIARWQAGFSLFQKISWWLGNIPAHPPVVDYPPGDLE